MAKARALGAEQIETVVTADILPFRHQLAVLAAGMRRR
jgi:hypothetical protein